MMGKILALIFILFGGSLLTAQAFKRKKTPLPSDGKPLGINIERPPDTVKGLVEWGIYDRGFILGFHNWGVPFSLLKAIAIRESQLNPSAVNFERDNIRSGDDSIGIMQMQLPTAKSIAVNFTPRDREPNRIDLFDFVNCIHLAAKLLKLDLLKRFPLKDGDGFPFEAVAAYNSGRPKYKEGKLINDGHVQDVKSYQKLIEEFEKG